MRLRIKFIIYNAFKHVVSRVIVIKNIIILLDLTQKSISFAKSITREYLIEFNDTNIRLCHNNTSARNRKEIPRFSQ